MRPQFHFTANGWINDPHGITFADGEYHIFYQFVPGSTAWSVACSWGHASGRDLFSLKERPPALEPGDGDDGIWSGSLMITPGGTPRIFYTSVSEADPALGRIRTAEATDRGWTRWTKGPVIAAAPVGLDVSAFRDPAIIDDGAVWRMVVGAKLGDGAAGVLGYSSSDGSAWREDGIVASRSSSDRDPVWGGSMWECPQIVEVDGQHALIVSVWDEDVLYDVIYAIGTYTNGAFTPGTWGRLSYGPSLYAATTFQDEHHRTCMMFWLRDVTGEGWSGAHSIPYRLSINSNRLSLTPHPDLAKYHAESAARGSGADVLWPGGVDTTLQVVQSGATLLSIVRDDHDMHVRLGKADYTLPWDGDVRVILDGGILEVSSMAGVFACSMTPLDENWELLGPGLHLRRLRQHA
jgi:beta-fructofuranosidase